MVADDQEIWFTLGALRLSQGSDTEGKSTLARERVKESHENFVLAFQSLRKSRSKMVLLFLAELLSENIIGSTCETEIVMVPMSQGCSECKSK